MTPANRSHETVSTAARGAPDSVSPGARQRGVDYASLWAQVDAESARVAVIDVERRVIVAGRSMGDSGGTNSRMSADTTLQRLFPGAVAQVEGWCTDLGGEPGELVAHGLSPRQWVYFWRLNAKAGVLAVVQHRYGRGAAAVGDTATIRLLCEHWLAPELHAMGIGRAAQATWNRVDRRQRASAPSELWAALAALGVAAAGGAWLAAGGAAPTLPVGVSMSASANAEQDSELGRLNRLSDETLKRSLAFSLAERDYGEAQEALTDHLSMGHFASAVVLNERMQVVAHAGLATPPAIGELLSAQLPGDARPLKLSWAGAPIGDLVIVPRKGTGMSSADTSAVPGAASSSRIVGALLALASVLSGAWLWRYLRARYR